MDIPRPSLDVDNLSSSSSLCHQRRRLLKRRLPKYSKEDRKQLSHVLRKYRRKQRKYVDDIEDPYPFDETYVFYCFTGK